MKISHLNGLRALEATLRNGTFTAAAEEMGVTVAATGQQIRGLEEFIGAKLFDRLPSGAKPTEQALAISARLTVGFTQIEEVFSELRSGGKEMRLAVTMSHFTLQDWLSPRLPDFHARVPGVQVDFQTGEKFADLFAGDIDMAIRFSPEPGPEYAYDDLYTGCFMPVCTPGFAARHGLSPECRDLTGVPLYRLHDATSDPAWIGWDELIELFGIRKDDSGPTQHTAGHRLALAGKGLLLSGLTESMGDLEDGRLVAPLGPDFVRQFTFGYRLVWPAGRTLSRPMKMFREWLLNESVVLARRASKILGVQLQK